MKNKRKLKYLIIILLILLVCLIGIILLASYKTNSQEYMLEGDGEAEINYPYMSYKLLLEYSGSVPSEEIGTSMYNFATVILPQYYEKFQNITDEEYLNEYYDENFEIVKEETGIETLEEFTEFISLLNTLNGDYLVFSSYKIDSASIRNLKSYITTDLYITYENNEDIKINARILNEYSTDSEEIKYTAD